MFSDCESLELDVNNMDNQMANVQLRTPQRDGNITRIMSFMDSPPYGATRIPIFNPVESQYDEHYFLLRAYYQYFFPYKSYFKWLNYDTALTKNFTHREFSFTLASDIYVRYNSFMSLEDLKKEIERMQPSKIDIGAVYTVKPKDKKTVSDKVFRPVEKELVFDIDMTDYDDIRTCCIGGAVCSKCWTYMTIAIKVIDRALRDDFGFKHRLWIYSGRRGVHCWVCDERARKLDNTSRKAIVSYLEIVKGGADSIRKVNVFNINHPFITRSMEIILPYFDSLVLTAQKTLDTPETWQKMLALIPEEGCRGLIEEAWRENLSKSGRVKWEQLKKALDDSSHINGVYFKKEKWLKEIILQYCYPRLDDKVSTTIGHLLKSPFSIHPKTQRVCVPISVENCDSFNPSTVPTLSDLSRERDIYHKMHGKEEGEGERRIPEYKKTSLAPYIEHFEKFVQSVLLDTQRAKRDESSRSMDF
ncbi:hypothetical protein BDF14DRAFT_1750909 [Spinellus fusiger]|nr:hypothetical protein BDF14DRAFT_1750909 [Spinellus fusiger]